MDILKVHLMSERLVREDVSLAAYLFFKQRKLFFSTGQVRVRMSGRNISQDIAKNVLVGMLCFTGTL